MGASPGNGAASANGAGAFTCGQTPRTSSTDRPVHSPRRPLERDEATRRRPARSDPARGAGPCCPPTPIRSRATAATGTASWPGLSARPPARSAPAAPAPVVRGRPPCPARNPQVPCGFGDVRPTRVPPSRPGRDRRPALLAEPERGGRPPSRHRRRPGGRAGRAGRGSSGTAGRSPPMRAPDRRTDGGGGREPRGWQCRRA
jgi:hypothetical protein